MNARLGVRASLLILTTATCSLMAEFRRPVLGHVPGAGNETLVRIDGIPGAQVQAAVNASEAFEWRVISSEQNYALAIRATDRAVVIVHLDRESLEPKVLEGITAPERIALSQNGAAAAIYSRAAASIHVISGLPDSPAFQRVISTAVLGNHVGSLAINDDGSLILASSGSETGELLIVGDNRTETLVLPSAISSIVFRPKKDEAAVLTTHQIFLVTQLSQGAVLQVLAGSEQGIMQPAAAEFSRDSRRMYVADPGARGIHFLEPGPESTITTVLCDCSPSGFQRLRGESVFWLKDASTSVSRLFDGDNVTPRILQIPQTAVSN